MRRSGRLLANSLLTLALLLTACGGGGGGGGGGGVPTTPQPGILFTASSGLAPAVRLVRGSGSTGTTLELQVQADQLTGVYGFAFDVTFPADLLRFDASSEGTYLSSGGFQTSLQVVEISPGDLVVGLTRLGDVAGRGGSGELMTLRFTGVGAGTGALSFSSSQAFDSSGQTLPGLSWLGGTVQVTL